MEDYVKSLYKAAETARRMLEEAVRLGDTSCVPMSARNLVIAVADAVTDHLLLAGGKMLAPDELEELELLLDEVQLANDRLRHAVAVDTIADGVNRVIRALEKVLEYLGQQLS